MVNGFLLLVNSNLNTGNLKFDYVANDGLYYNVKVGADTVRKKCNDVTRLGVIPALNGGWSSTWTYDIGKYYSKYKNITVDNIIPKMKYYNSYGSNVSMTPTYSYNQTTGIYTMHCSSGIADITFEFYIIND